MVRLSGYLAVAPTGAIANLLIGQRMCTHRKRDVEAAIVGAVQPILALLGAFLTYVAVRFVVPP